MPVAAFASAQADGWQLAGWVGAEDGRSVRAQASSTAGQSPEQLGQTVAEALLAQGAAALLGDAAR